MFKSVRMKKAIAATIAFIFTISTAEEAFANLVTRALRALVDTVASDGPALPGTRAAEAALSDSHAALHAPVVQLGRAKAKQPDNGTLRDICDQDKMRSERASAEMTAFLKERSRKYANIPGVEPNDLVQVTLEKILRACKKKLLTEPPESFAAYSYDILKNTATDIYYKENGGRTPKKNRALQTVENGSDQLFEPSLAERDRLLMNAFEEANWPQWKVDSFKLRADEKTKNEIVEAMRQDPDRATKLLLEAFSRIRKEDLPSPRIRQEDVDKNGIGEVERHADPRPGPSVLVEQQELARVLLAKLSPRQREAFELQLLGHTIKEIAAKMGGIGEDTVDELLTKARSRLRKAIAEIDKIQ